MVISKVYGFETPYRSIACPITYDAVIGSKFGFERAIDHPNLASDIPNAFHAGMDIHCIPDPRTMECNKSLDYKVYSPLSGVVSDLDQGCKFTFPKNGGKNDCEGYGNNITINYEDIGLAIRYAHLSSIYVKLNQIIESNQVIGVIGNSGNAFEEQKSPHLHLEAIPLKNFQSNGSLPVNSREFKNIMARHLLNTKEFNRSEQNFLFNMVLNSRMEDPYLKSNFFNLQSALTFENDYYHENGPFVRIQKIASNLYGNPHLLFSCSFLNAVDVGLSALYPN